MKLVDWVLGVFFGLGLLLAGGESAGWPWNVPAGLAMVVAAAIHFARKGRRREA